MNPFGFNIYDSNRYFLGGFFSSFSFSDDVILAILAADELLIHNEPTPGGTGQESISQNRLPIASKLDWPYREKEKKKGEGGLEISHFQIRIKKYIDYNLHI